MAVKYQFLCAKVYSILVPSPPHFWLLPPHLVWSGDGTGTQYIRQYNQSFQLEYFNFFHSDDIFLKHKRGEHHSVFLTKFNIDF